VDRRSGAATAGTARTTRSGSLFATGLVAGTITGTACLLHWPDEPGKPSWLDPFDGARCSTTGWAPAGTRILGVALFAVMGIVLYR